LLDLNSKRAIGQTVISAANTMAKIAAQPGFDKLDPTSPLVHEFNFAREQFINGSNQLQDQGVTRNDDIDRYNKDVLGGPYGLATAKTAQKFAGLVAQGYHNNLTAKADTETEVNERAELDQKTGRVRKGVHYDADQLLRGTKPTSSINFQPAVPAKR